MFRRNFGYKSSGRAERVAGSARERTVEVPGGSVWSSVFLSNERSDGSRALPLVTVHGGPGFPHDYLTPLAALATTRPVLFYDQLGCGRSARPVHEWCWSVPRYVAELHAVVQAAGFECFHLLGHSWGSIVVFEYAYTHPSAVRSLIYASPCLSIPRWSDDARRLRDTLPEEHRTALAEGEASGDLSTDAYVRALAEYYARFVYRMDPLPSEVAAATAGFGGHAYHHMWGPNEALVTGTLRRYDATEGLGGIGAPAMVTCGRFDEATPEACADYAVAAGGAALVVFEESAHLPHLSERDAYAKTVESFLGRVELEQQP